jgi:hypothetical protein
MRRLFDRTIRRSGFTGFGAHGCSLSKGDVGRGENHKAEQSVDQCAIDADVLQVAADTEFDLLTARRVSQALACAATNAATSYL